MAYLNGYLFYLNYYRNNLNLKKMTIDKIKAYMPAQLFDFWCNCNDLAAANKAKELLKKELAAGLLCGVQYQAELQLLQNLTESE